MPEAAEVSEGRGSGGTVITEQTSWPAAHGAGLAAASGFGWGSPRGVQMAEQGPGPAAHAPSSCCSRLQGGGWSFGSLHSPFSPLGELLLTGGVTFQTLFLRLTEGVLTLCRKRIPRKRPLC